MATMRPHPLWWVYYQYGGRLPDRYREWVLRDGTCRTWLLRVFLRGLVQVVPITAVLFVVFRLLGGAWYLSAASVALGILVSVRYTMSYAAESVDSRLARHGYPPGHGSAVRRAAYQAAHALEAERYRAVWRRTED